MLTQDFILSAVDIIIAGDRVGQEWEDKYELLRKSLNQQEQVGIHTHFDLRDLHFPDLNWRY